MLKRTRDFIFQTDSTQEFRRLYILNAYKKVNGAETHITFCSKYVDERYRL